jgi:hypothetical protein
MVDLPFPVETPFAMRPNMRPWQDREPIIIRDHRFDEYIAEKKKYYDPVYGDNPDLSLLKQAIKCLQNYDSSFMFDIESDDPVYRLTMSMQEDWVLFAPDRKDRLSAQMLSVHLPSGWNPREKANMTFAEIHEPIADNDLIMRAADHIAKTITAKGPYVRHVWAISNTGSLSRRPDLIPERTDNDLNQMWYRCERQTTIPVNSLAALFLIRVFVAPLKDIFQDPAKKKAIISSVNSMSDAVIAYKGYEKLRDYLNRPDV